MPSRLKNLLKNYKELIATDSNIRNRMLAVVVLLFLLIVLVMFSMQQGFSVLEQSGSQLMVFVAINVNIVLLAIVFYLIARNLLKLSYERRRHVLGVNLKTKLITSFIILSLPAMGFHLFASFFITTNLETWLKGQQESMVHSAQNISEAYHNNLRKWTTTFLECPRERCSQRKIPCQVPKSILAPASGICSEVFVNALRICEGISSGPSVV